MVFSILQSATTSRNLVQIFNQGVSFLSESNLKRLFVSDTLYLLQFNACSYESGLTKMLQLLGMRSYNKH